MNKAILDTKELFIFDLDGTVTDTEPCHFESYRRTLTELCNSTVTPEEFLSCYVGHSETEIYSLLKKNKSIEFDDILFFETRINHLFEIVKERGLTTAPFYQQLEKLYPHRRFIALTSQRVYVLERFRQIVDYGKITEFISVADKPYGKKDVLADTVGYLGVPQDKVVIFEDFAPTMKAAMENGVWAVGVKHDFNRLCDDDCNDSVNIHTEAIFS